MEELLTPEELAAKLKISRVAVYKWVRLKKIPFFHIEKCVRFDPAEIREWLEGKRNGEFHISAYRGKRRGRPKKEGAGGEAPAPGDASRSGQDNRLPDRESGVQEEGLKIIK